MASEITVLLREHRNGVDGALNRLASLLYPQLKAMARNRAGRGSAMGATTLVNETFLKLLAGGQLETDDRRQFFALAATIMRQIIIDEIRYLAAEKRKREDVTFAETIIGDDAHERAEFLLQVDEVLSIVEAEDERMARVFECRYFAGLTTDETAEALSTSSRSVERLWAASRSRLAELMDDSSK